MKVTPQYSSVAEHLPAIHVCVMQFYESVGVYGMLFLIFFSSLDSDKTCQTQSNLPVHLIVHDFKLPVLEIFYLP